MKIVNPTRSKAGRQVKPDFELLATDEILTKRELALLINLTTRTVERSQCPTIILDQRAGAKGIRFQRRYVKRVALEYFASLGRSGVRLAMLQWEAA